jgi:hypothetical protein
MRSVLRPQELLAPPHMMMPVEPAAALMGIYVKDLIGVVESGKSRQIRLITLDGQKHVEYLKNASDEQEMP